MEWRVRIRGLEATLKIHRSMKNAVTVRLQLCILLLQGHKPFCIYAASLAVWVCVLPLLPSLFHYPLSGDHYPFGWKLWTIMRSATRLNEEQTQLGPGLKYKTFIPDFLQGIKMLWNDRKQTHCLHGYSVLAQEGRDHGYFNPVSVTMNMTGTLYVCCLRSEHLLYYPVPA